jgi:hypothetical protein
VHILKVVVYGFTTDDHTNRCFRLFKGCQFVDRNHVAIVKPDVVKVGEGELRALKITVTILSERGTKYDIVLANNTIKQVKQYIMPSPQ